MMGNMKVEGVEEAKNAFSNMLKDYPTAVVATGIRKAAKPFSDRAASSDPKFKKSYTAKVYNKKKKQPIVAVGAFGGKSRKVQRHRGDEYMPMLTILRWVQYGTLARRHPGHDFKNPRKRISRRWKGGVTARLTVEKAWEAMKQTVISAIPSELKKAAMNYDKRKGKTKKWLWDD